MEQFRYERLVIGYHGCDRDVRDQVLSDKSGLRPRYTQMLGEAYPDFEELLQIRAVKVPANAPVSSIDLEFLLRRKDCAVMNWVWDRYENISELACHTVRGLFQEGDPAFPGSGIRKKSHIQIAVRHPSCILGYFLPA